MTTQIRQTPAEFTGDFTALPILGAVAPAIPGLTHHYKAADLAAAHGATITSWADSVGTLALAGSAVVKVTDGIKRVRFNETGGLNQFLSATPVGSSEIKTIVMLARVYATGTQGIFGAGGGYVNRGGGFATFNYGGATGNRVSTADPLPKFVPISMGGVAGDIHWAAASQSGVIADGTGTNTIIRPGLSSGSTYGNVEFVEILTSSLALTDIQIQAAHTYLLGKYPSIV